VKPSARSKLFPASTAQRSATGGGGGRCVCVGGGAGAPLSGDAVGSTVYFWLRFMCVQKQEVFEPWCADAGPAAGPAAVNVMASASLLSALEAGPHACEREVWGEGKGKGKGEGEGEAEGLPSGGTSLVTAACAVPLGLGTAGMVTDADSDSAHWQAMKRPRVGHDAPAPAVDGAPAAVVRVVLCVPPHPICSYVAPYC
jgi:hypothetical protein